MKNSVFQMPRKPKSGIKSSYSNEFRKQVAEEYLSSSFSLREVSERYNLPSRGTVNGFVNWYKANFDLGAITLDSKKTSSSEHKRTSDLEKDQLEQMLQLAKLKIESLDAMIDIAEDRFKIDIRKKSGAKSSKK